MTAKAVTTNQLINETSPYLLQHAHNPVDWYPWGAEAFTKAKAEGRPVFLSIGYSTCHWCHVMAHESFEDLAIAKAINRDYVAIKVDREERPDVDAVYMAACTAMNQSGGWPLTVLLTPHQQPFWAGTYLPKRQLLSLLHQAAKLWQEEPDALLLAGENLTKHLQKEEAAHPSVPTRELPTEGASFFAHSFDSAYGGFGKAPKFPMPHNLIFLMRYARLAKDAKARDMAERTLDAMYLGGMFDHVGGGFSRYSTDNQWLVPHFEKMLYDNALLAFCYVEAFTHTKNAAYAQVARRTIDYVLEELSGQLGGFCCGQDADSDGVEGKYYVLTPAELSDVLGDGGAKRFCEYYGITAKGNFDGKSIPNLLHQPVVEEVPADILALNKQVFAYRKQRTALHRDDKVLTAWNGLMIAALALAGIVMDEAKYLQAAKQTVAFIDRYLTLEDGRVLASWRDGRTSNPGKLDDYAFYAWGLLELYSAILDVFYLEKAARLARLLLEYFFDAAAGGFYPYASDGEQLITRTKEVYDGALPSGNAVAALVLCRLDRLTGEAFWQQASEKQFTYLAGIIRSHPAGYSFTLLAMLETLWPSAELVCAMPTADIPADLMAFLQSRPLPNLTVLIKTPDNSAALEGISPFTKDYLSAKGEARYYLCQGKACDQPVTSVDALKKLMFTKV